MFQDEPALTPPSYCSSASRPNCACSLIPSPPTSWLAAAAATTTISVDTSTRAPITTRLIPSPSSVLRRQGLSTLNRLYSRVSGCDREVAPYNEGEGA